VIALLLLTLDFAVLIIKPSYVVAMTEVGTIFNGGAVAPIGPLCAMIAIISAYAFLNSQESKVRSTFFFLLGLTGVLYNRGRGAELSLLFALMVLVYFWAKIGRYTTYIFISGLSLFILLTGMLAGSVGGERIWNIFNRGQTAEGIETASGRTDIWYFVIQYCTSHPWGMGYIAGFRLLFRNYYALGLQVIVSRVGNAHSTYIQVLSDAGWLALAIYLIIMVKVVRIALRFANKQLYSKLAPDSDYRRTIECSLVMLVYCVSSGFSAADYVVPLRAVFYWQFILIGIILGVSARMIIASRPRRAVLAE
jgi:O-antigen ligase